MPSLETRARAIADNYQSPITDVFKAVRRQLARGGRPPTITQDLTDRIGDMLADTGEYVDDTCQALGVPRRNYYNWLSQGERDDKDDLDTPQARFWHTIKTAESQGKYRLGVQWIEKPRDFAAYATRLERRDPEKWARRAESNDGPRVVVQIGIQASDVQVSVSTSENAFAPLLSPQPFASEPVANSLTPQGYAEHSCLITGPLLLEQSANPSAPAQDQPADQEPAGRAVRRVAAPAGRVSARVAVSGEKRGGGRGKKKGAAHGSGRSTHGTGRATPAGGDARAGLAGGPGEAGAAAGAGDVEVCAAPGEQGDGAAAGAVSGVSGAVCGDVSAVRG